jgi:hypothetical protein
VARRRLTVKRIDPWSVLKFGAVVNAAMLGIGLLVVGVIFYIVDRLGLIDQVCGIALDVGFTACGLNVGNLFRAIALLGLLGLVIWTAVLVFLSFLHNLIADLTGGLTLSVIDDTPGAAARGEVSRPMMTSTSTPLPAQPHGKPANSAASATGRTRPAAGERPADGGARKQQPASTTRVEEPSGEELFGER